MRCVRINIRLLLPFIASLVARGNDSAKVLRSSLQSRCLLQSSRNVAELRFVQPKSSIILPPREGPSNSTNSSETEDLDRDQKVLGIFNASYNLWAGYAKLLAFNWAKILLWFCIGFAVTFPFLHWYFESREIERNMFMKSESNQGGSAPSPSGNEGGIAPSPSDGSMTRSSSKGSASREDDVQFVYIAINKTGGINKIKDLIKVDRPKLRRPFKVVSKVVSIAFTIYMLIQQDTTMLYGAELYYQNKTETSALPKNLERYLEFTDNMSLISVRHAVCVAVAELLGLSAMAIWLLYRFGVFVFCRDVAQAKYDAFVSLYETCDGLTLLSSFSALRLISIAHPALLIRKFQFFMQRPFVSQPGRFGIAMQLLYFLITRIAAIFLGALAFGVKVAFVSVQVHMPLTNKDDWWRETMWRWLVIIMLLVQTLGAIGVEYVMFWRVLLIVVEGGDRKVTLKKIRLANVYLSKVFEKIYEEYYLTGKYLQFCVLMLTFDHIDLQHLLIDEASDTAPDADVGEVPISPDALGDLFSAFG